MKPLGTYSVLAGALTIASPLHAQAQTKPVKPATASAAPAIAAPASAAKPAVAGTSITSKFSQWQGNTLRLDGNVRIVAPGQLDVAADAVAVDVGGKVFEQIRALGNVKLKVDVPARTGGTPFHVESSSQSATLDPKRSTLVLTGRVTGWYQPKGGQRTLLGGEKVSVKFDKGNTSIIADKGSIMVPVLNEGAFAGIGSITVTGNQSVMNQNTDSSFTGGARAYSSGVRKFDVSADSFVLSRGADGTLDTLKTKGRTTLISDLPPGTPDANGVGTPVRLEVSADSSVVKQVDNTLSFDGNVKGLYVLQNASGERISYPFTGDKAVFKLIPASATTKADFSLEFSGAPTTILAPPFALGN